VVSCLTLSTEVVLTVESIFTVVESVLAAAFLPEQAANDNTDKATRPVLIMFFMSVLYLKFTFEVM